MTMLIQGLTEWLLTYAIHSSVLLGAAALIDWQILRGRAHWQELLWKTALLGPLLSASLQVAAGTGWVMRLDLPAATAMSPSVAATPALESSGAGLPRPGKPADIPIGSPKTASDPVPVFSASLPGATWLGLWLLGAAFFLGRLQLSAFRLRMLLLDRTAFPAHRLPASLPGWVTVSLCSGIDQPMAVGRRQICVPAQLLSMSGPQIEAALAHELAHLQRGDSLWRWVCLVIQSALFFQPLNIIASRRIAEAAEQGSDALALQSGTPSADLLQVLASFALNRPVQPAARAPLPLLASGIAGRPHDVVRRMENLMAGRLKTAPGLYSVMAAVLVLSLAAGLALPGISTGHTRSRTEVSVTNHGNSTLVNVRGDSSSGDSVVVTHTKDDLSIKLNAAGSFSVDHSEQRLESLDGEFDLTVTEDGVKRRIRYRGRNGSITPQFFVDGKLVAEVEQGAAWFASQLPRLLRVSGLNAEVRAQRVFQRSGMGALVSEVSMLEGEHVRRKYLSAVSDLPLGAEEVARLLAASAELLSSDHEQRKLLSALAENQAAQLNWQNFLAATGELRSDREQRQALQSALAHLPLEAELAHAYLAATEGISSDLEHRQALESLVQHRAFIKADKALALAAAGNIGSDLEQRRLLVAMVESNMLSETELVDLVDHASANIGSEQEIMLLLSQMLDAQPGDSVRNAIQRAAEALGSAEQKKLRLKM